MVEHEIAMRWGDIDSYEHVNNVRFLDYAAEGRERLMRDGALAEDSRVAAVTIDYLVPVLLSTRPVVVTNELDGDVLRQEICVDTEGGRVVNARVVSRFGSIPSAAPASQVSDAVQVPVAIRLHDIGPGGVVTPERTADVVQELRIAQRTAADPDRVWGKSVVASVAIDFHGPIRHGVPDLSARCWTSRVGISSYTAEAEISDGRGVLVRASSVMVGWDPLTGSSRPMTEQERAVLVSAPAPAGGSAPRR
ncbi:acyl-CoA thioesterase [Aeromicrobium sp. UC242_57]|uniref:acyl-CoA thioesterase n=1 Tax=Aeromicrobium sp. UC242_57 TaxID=3374624 RepID=UPI00379F1901